MRAILVLLAAGLSTAVRVRFPAFDRLQQPDLRRSWSPAVPPGVGRHGQPSDALERLSPPMLTQKRALVVTIGDHEYDLGEWAASHPGGLDIIEKNAGRNITAAFLRAGHSQRAHEMLKDFLVEPAQGARTAIPGGGVRPIKKLFTHEDSFHVHKALGVFVLLHYVFRYALSLTVNPAAGFGAGQLRARVLAALAAHGMLSFSSLLFPVPRARVVGRPMIWSEYRAHNLIFALRSLTCCLFTTLAANGIISRSAAVLGCAASLPAAMGAADAATAKLRLNRTESTTGTMPYWEGCSPATSGRFKLFYAYCQVGGSVHQWVASGLSML
jgi:hypothetical protein